MEVQLFHYNLSAYRAVTAMLQETGRAAVIHPTGTGKSFLGLKLAQDHPTARICWLGPSAYIYQTQLENWRSAGGDTPDNINFLTYARLMGLESGEIEQRAPQWIVLDEFHRCGAEQWGKGVARLLNAYPNVPVLGLSATNIRYLDNQRDMADELFDGNIASEMTLGEAIARGILAAPRYVVSVYSYQKELERFQRRAHRVKSRAARDQAEQYLEALRRALEKADGLDQVFERHMTDRSGKYIVFCSDVAHMSQLLEQAPKWFSRVDPAPHIYRAYSDNPETSAAFAGFQADHSSHLKLLYCIDMLNEGIHVEDVSGVILCRPTVSPIIYKQQIGRALSAGTRREPVIFDIVNNFENLYSIGTIQQEMQEAAAFYRAQGREGELVRERFQILDEVRDCRQLFAALQETLSAPWELMYQQAKGYYQEHGDLNVPKRYQTQEGYSLGSWLTTQRKVRAGVQYGNLSEERIQKLDEIGMVWGSRWDLCWERNYEAARQYRKTYGNLDVPTDYVSPSGVRLGVWLRNLRQYQAGKVRATQLTPERIAALDALDMVWDKFSYQWEQQYLACVQYYLKHGHLDIPASYVSPEGLRTGAWVRRMWSIHRGRKSSAAALTPEQLQRLNAIHFIWEDARSRNWEYGFEQAQSYYRDHGSLDMPKTYVTQNGFALGRWLERHRNVNPATGKTDIAVTPERKKKLESLGFSWEVKDAFQERLNLCRRYVEQHGALDIPQSYVVEGVWLGKWLYEQRRIYRGEVPGKTLTSAQIQALESVGMDWSSAQERAWVAQYRRTRHYAQINGGLHGPVAGAEREWRRLNAWLIRQRKARGAHLLSHNQIAQLDALGMEWGPVQQAEQTVHSLLVPPTQQWTQVMLEENRTPPAR